jgi:glutathione synthase/RimK-type ligase-like ATP-grasp enzyme
MTGAPEVTAREGAPGRRTSLDAVPTRRVAIATCAELPEPDAESALLVGALRERGVDACTAAWNARPRDGWDAFDAVVVRATWDYPSAPDAFLRWIEEVGERLHNSHATIGWNIDKRYLFDLERAGIPVIAGDVVAAGAEFSPPGGRFVVKPTVSAGAKDTAVYDGSRHAAARAHVRALHDDGRAVLVQPYLERVATEAETAVIFIDGELSHAMRKEPLLALDQEEPAGLYRAETMSRREADADVLHLAHRALTYATERFERPLYARVDVLRADDGSPAVLELELIEPSLFLDYAPGSADALADAIVRRVEAGRAP